MEIDWIPSLVGASFSRELNLLYIVLKDVNLVSAQTIFQKSTWPENALLEVWRGARLASSTSNAGFGFVLI
jgi:hypothetical protein